MGSFISIVGHSNIPKEKLHDFKNSVLHMMDIGGMMRLEDVTMFNKKINLLKKASIFDEERECYWACFNYFEDNFWERMGYNPQRNSVFSGKVGWSVYNRITGLCHMIEELYSDGRCVVGGDLHISPLSMLLWINKEFGTSFNIFHRFDIRKIYHAIKENQFYKNRKIDIEDIENYSTLYGSLHAYSTNSVKGLTDELKIESTKENVEDFFKNRQGESEDILVLNESQLQSLISLESSRRHLFSINELLGCDSSDERLYWYSNGVFDLSSKCKSWLSDIKRQHRQILENIGKPKNINANIIDEFITLLDQINNRYGQMFMFSDTFYDIIYNINSPDVVAAVELLDRLFLQGIPELDRLEADLGWYGVKKSRPRQELKRYLALLGNRELRKEILSF